MEAFSGLFIASANPMHARVPAVLRRFDLKLWFGFLQPDQAHEVLLAYLRSLGMHGVGFVCVAESSSAGGKLRE